MAMEIFRLVGSIFVDSGDADKSLAKTDKKAQGVGKTLGEGVKTAGKWAAGIAAGSAAAVTAVTAFATNTADAADEIDKMSQRLGVSREAYQELDFAMSQSGVDVNSFSTGMKTLLKNMDAAKDGGDNATAMFKTLGVEVMTTDGSMRSQEEVLFDVIAAFQGMEESAEKSRLAQELFGKQGQEILPMLNDSAGGIQEMREQAHELGLVLDDELIDSGVTLKDTMDQLKRSFEAVMSRLGGAVLPLVQKVAEYIISKMPDIESMIRKLEPVLKMVFEELVPPLMDLGDQILPTIMDLINDALPVLIVIVGEILPIISQILQAILPFLAELVQKILPVVLHLIQAILPIISELLPLLEPILDLVMTLLEPLLELIDFILPPIMTLIKGLAQVITGVLRPVITWLSGFLGGALRNSVEGFKDVVQAIPQAFRDAWAGIQIAWSAVAGWFQRLGDGIKSIFTRVGDGIKGVFKAPLNTIISGINAFIRGLNKITIPDWVPGVGGYGFHINELPQLAKGGVLEKGQTGLLEGTGAEAVVPLENNAKWVSAVARDMEHGIGGEKTEKLLTAILAELEDIARVGIYLDSKKLVGALAGPMDRELGRVSARKVRT